MTYTLQTFSELSTQELYDILQLRSEIFVVEQDCVYQDMDGLDQQCLHLSAREDGRLIGYVRILPPGLAYETPTIGRVVVSKDQRGRGIGVDLMERAQSVIYTHFSGPVPITIMAQSYLLSWYGALGYEVQGAEFLEDGIPHVIMVRPAL